MSCASDATIEGKTFARMIERLPYRQIGAVSGLPFYHGHEESGRLSNYIIAALSPSNAPTPDDLYVTRTYCAYVLAAPCWDQNPHADAKQRRKLKELRERVHHIETQRQLNKFLDDCIRVGIDPL